MSRRVTNRSSHVTQNEACWVEKKLHNYKIKNTQGPQGKLKDKYKQIWTR